MAHTSEHEFLRRTLKSAVHDEPPTLCEESLDWAYIQEQAQIHRICGLIYHTCFSQRTAFTTVPTTVVQTFRDAYQQTYLHNTLWYQQLAGILREFARQGIFPIALKGIVLARMVYRNIGLRPMQDIDLLLRKEDLPAAATILQALGYSRLLQHLTYVSDWHRAYEEKRWQELEPQGNHLPLFIKKLGTVPLCLELHHHLPAGLAFEQVETTVAADSDFHVRTLTPEYFLFHLCCHLNAHGEEEKMPYLIWYCDLGKFLKMYQARLDWDLFATLGRQYQVAELIRQRLAEACRLFALELPIHLPDGELALQNLYRKIFPQQPANQDLAFLQTVFNAGTSQGLRYLWECLFPSRSFLIARYRIRQPYWVGGYYLLRFWKACFRGIRLLKKLVRRALLSRK